MKEGCKPALVPKLRFPAFREAEGWKTKLLGNLCKIRTGKKDANEGAADGLYPFFTCAENHIFSRTYSFDTEAILIAGNANVGQTKYYQGKFEAYQRTYVLTDFSGINVPYLYAVLNAKLRESLLGRVQVSAMSYIKLPMLQEYALAVPPSSAEQQKIAECLSSVEEVIVAQARKLDELKTHKKGLMQQLFPREGETQPRLRFLEFQGAGEWKPDTLENLCTAKISYGIVQAGPHVPNGMPYIKSTDLNSLLRLSRLERTSDVIAKKYQRSEVVPGDLVFSLRGNIGVSQIVPKEIPVANLTQGTARIRTKGPSLFFLYALRSQPVHSRILAVSKGSTFQEISLEHLRQIQVIHPKEDEQQRIADCLCSLDDLIAAENQKLEALKTHKRGLMQQLFPSPEEAVG